MSVRKVTIAAMAEQSLPEFARQIQRADEGARAHELGLRVLHAELVEQRSPERTITVRAHQADVQHELREPEVVVVLDGTPPPAACCEEPEAEP